MVSDVISTIMSALQNVFVGIGDSLTDLWSSLIYGVLDAGVDEIVGTADDIIGLHPFAEWMLIFMGFSLGVGILYAVLRKVI